LTETERRSPETGREGGGGGGGQTGIFSIAQTESATTKEHKSRDKTTGNFVDTKKLTRNKFGHNRTQKRKTDAIKIKSHEKIRRKKEKPRSQGLRLPLKA
jgi:hypothetical protein